MDTKTNDAPTDAQVLQLSDALQRQHYAVLDANPLLATMPTVAAHALAEVLTAVLVVVVQQKPERLTFATTLLDEVRRRVVAMTATPAASARTH